MAVKALKLEKFEAWEEAQDEHGARVAELNGRQGIETLTRQQEVGEGFGLLSQS